MKALLIAETEQIARRTKEALGLGDQWMTCGSCSPMTGRRFDKVHVLPIDRPVSDMAWWRAHSAWMNANVRTKLPPGAQPTYQGEIMRREKP